jgi:Flp pilus assembly pilin Flp
MASILLRLRTDEDGQDVVEYALLLGFIAVVCVLNIQQTGNAVRSVWDMLATNLADAAAKI